MERILVILLFFCVTVDGQGWQKSSGKFRTNGQGGYYRYPEYVAPEVTPFDGNIYYVSTTGDNDGPGTIADPWATITYAMSASSGVQAGDSIYVKAGNYGTELVSFDISGTASNRIIIQGYKTTPGDQPKDDWTYGDSHDAAEMPLYDYNDRDHSTAKNFNFNEQEYITVNNMQITEVRWAAYISGGHNIIENFYCTQMGDYGIRGDEDVQSGIFLIGNKLPVDGKEITWAGIDADSCKVINCAVVNSSGEGIWAFSDYDSIIDCRFYCDEGLTTEDEAAGTDYYIVLTGSYSVVKDCYWERIGNIKHGGHGGGVKGSWLGHADGGPNDAQYNVIEGCTSRNITGEHYWVAHNNVNNNIFRNNIAKQGANGIMIRDSANNNLFEDMLLDSLLYGGIDPPEPAIAWVDGSEDLEGYTSVNNTFQRIIISDCNSVLGIEDDYLGNDSEANDNKLYNFTVYNCAFFISRINGTNSGNVIKNWIVTDVDNDYYSLTKTDNFSYTYSDFYNNGAGFSVPSGTGNITTNPLLTNPATDDFTLQAESPCIDEGTDVGLDYNGDAPDMGAIEYESLPWWLLLVLIKRRKRYGNYRV